VQDEAAAGRDSSRLLPVLIERVEAPLGFRQYHAVDLTARRLSQHSIEPLLDAVQAQVSDLPTSARSPASGRRWPLIAAAAAIFILAIVFAGWSFFGPAVPPNSILVESSDTDAPMAEVLARSIAADLGRFRTGPLAALNIREKGARHAYYRARIGVLESPSKLTLQVSLGSVRVDNLWSASLDGASNQQSDLNRQAAAMLGAALQCDMELTNRGDPLPADLRPLYVDGCARLADPGASREQAISSLRQLTQKAPKFAPGWAHLAYAEFSGIDSAPLSEKSNVAWNSGRHAKTASSLDATLPEIYYVRAFDRSWAATSNSDALKVLDEGLQRSPQSALLYFGRADILMRVGRIGEALDSARRAISLNPLSPEILSSYILALTYSGRLAAAKRELEAAESDWPRSAAIASIRFIFDLRYGDPEHALTMIRENEVPELTPDQDTQLYLKARMNPTSANIDASIRSYAQSYAKHPFAILSYVQALSQFGRVDEAYRVLATAPVDPWYINGDILFRPSTANMRRDRRFIDLAYRTGQLAFWSKSGIWPDFCKDQRLSYDCQVEAARYAQ
jgi:tetratricopeptide (TPR) repeat protein